MDNIDVQEYMMQGKVLSGQGRYEEALGYYEKAEKLEKALAICNDKMNMTGRPGGNTCAEFAAAVMAEVEAM